MSNQTAIFAAGCFWCIEAVYNRLKGVHNATSGYINGHTPAPTYAEVCSGHSGHAEAVKIEFDPEIISYRTLLEVLFTLHDPTQLNRQGHDVGTQYRSGIYYLDEAQKAEALRKQQAAKAQAEKKTSAQDALNNKAAKSAANPQAILEGSTTGSRVIIQAGAYSSSAQANQVLQKLADAGVSAHVSESETSKGTVYRVRTGSYPNRTAANQALAKIRQQGLDGMVIGQ